MSTISLNARVYYKDSEGIYQTSTVRQAIASGKGNAYDYLKSSPSWDMLLTRFNEENVNPVAALDQKTRQAEKKVAKAIWWHDEGMYKSTMTATTDDPSERLEAWNEYKFAEQQLEDYRAQQRELVEDTLREAREAREQQEIEANARIQETIAKRQAFEESQRGAWESFNLSASSDSWDGTVRLVRLGKLGACLPVYPWNNCEVQRSYTCNFLSSSVLLSKGEDIKYPTGTKLRITYTTPGAPYILSRTAYLNAEGKPFQVSPEELSFDSIQQFIDYNQRLQRARITVTLPDPLTPKQRQVAEMEEWLQEEGQQYLPVTRKIAMIYQEFNLKSRVALDHNSVTINPVWYEGYQNPREVAGHFIRDTRCELEIRDTNGIWWPVAECEGRAYYKNLLVNNLKQHVMDGKFIFRLSWNTTQGRNRATLSL